jgi:hypothetical protein
VDDAVIPPEICCTIRALRELRRAVPVGDTPQFPPWTHIGGECFGCGRWCVAGRGTSCACGTHWIAGVHSYSHIWIANRWIR